MERANAYWLLLRALLKEKQTIVLLSLALLLIGIGVTVSLVQRQQQTQSKAALNGPLEAYNIGPSTRIIVKNISWSGTIDGNALDSSSIPTTAPTAVATQTPPTNTPIPTAAGPTPTPDVTTLRGPNERICGDLTGKACSNLTETCKQDSCRQGKGYWFCHIDGKIYCNVDQRTCESENGVWCANEGKCYVAGSRCDYQ